MFNPILLIMVEALFISMLIVRYKKILTTNEVDVGLFVGLGDDIVRACSLLFPKNRLEVPESVVAKIICKCKDRISLMLVTTVSNNLYTESVKARSPTSVDGRDSYSYSRC